MGKFGMLLNTIRILLIVSAALVLASLAVAQPQHALNLMPMPSSVQAGGGQLPVDRSFSVAITGIRDARLERGVVRFVAEQARCLLTQYLNDRFSRRNLKGVARKGRLERGPEGCVAGPAPVEDCLYLSLGPRAGLTRDGPTLHAQQAARGIAGEFLPAADQ